jgi:hypothetical protein
MTAVSDYRFVAIIRTQGRRPEMLAEALQSLSFQCPGCVAVVAVHAPFDRVNETAAICREAGLSHQVLHAKDTERKRGYPLNIGLSYCYEAGGFDGLLFLDDDDIIYPQFTRRMAQALMTSEADVIYAGSNQRCLQGAPEAGYFPLSIAQLFIQNFIPINSYVIRFSRLVEARLFFDETLDYTEDWHFLLRLLELGFRFEPLRDTLSEFRMTSDGNMTVKTNAAAWNQDSLRIRKYINKTMFSIGGADWVGIAPHLQNGITDSAHCGEASHQPAGDPRAFLLWEKLRRLWHKLPFRVRVLLTRAYNQYYRRV